MSRLKIDKKLLPVMVTIGLFVIMFTAASLKYRGFFSLQVFLNLFIDNAFLLISAVGVTFVILTGGIDISVGAVMALVGVVVAFLVERAGFNPYLAIVLGIAMATLLGAGMGALITYFKFPPFVATLTGLFLARGLCYVISIESITINNPTLTAISHYQIHFGEHGFISINVVIALVVLVAGILLAQHTRFGRVVYAIGGNEQSALLMGLPMERTKVLVYALSGFCSGVAGVVFSLYTLSGYGNNLVGYEMDAISSVVIGGTLLTGGVGYVVGSGFGVLIQGVIQNIIMFDGSLNSWWTKIIVGLLTLIFILMQRALSAGKPMQVSNITKGKNR
ncbi:MAG: sugar ABC transporter permease YjfF [Anaerolineaceae bacterium]|nr:sugar ABC transporter permease YjfF [Anaerolineaceae bacterium]